MAMVSSRDQQAIARVIVASPWGEREKYDAASSKATFMRLSHGVVDAAGTNEHDLCPAGSCAQAVVDVVGGNEQRGVRQADALDQITVDEEAEERM